MGKKIKKVIKNAGIAVAGITTVNILADNVAEKLMTIALDRKIPNELESIMNKVSGSSDTSECEEATKKAIERLEKTTYQPVEIISFDGLKLKGYWIKNPSARRVIIAVHGWRSSWKKDFGLIFDFLRDNDCSVLCIDQRGQGQSEGNYMGFGMTEKYDCLRWCRWVDEEVEHKLPIYLYGVSMGSASVLMTAGCVLPEQVKGIIADCGFTSPYAIWKHVTEKNLHLPYGIFEKSVNNICREKIKLLPAGSSTVDAMKKCKVPVLFIHGTEDKFVPIEMTYENYKACNAPKYLLTVPGAGHAMSYFIEAERYENKLKEFWNRYDC